MLVSARHDCVPYSLGTDLHAREMRHATTSRENRPSGAVSRLVAHKASVRGSLRERVRALAADRVSGSSSDQSRPVAAAMAVTS